MKLAIMQPYLFPYIGYFQLINTVDKFVIYDDVSFIKQGWINRNRILVAGQPQYFSIPVKDRSSFKLIREIEISNNLDWRSKILRSIEFSYKKTPCFNEVFPIIEKVFCLQTDFISELAAKSITTICEYLDIYTQFVDTSSIYQNSNLKGAERVLDICQRENTSEYINPIGGIELYSKDTFLKKSISLHFIKTNFFVYPQLRNEFVPWLSIIDVLMFNSREKVRGFLKEFELI